MYVAVQVVLQTLAEINKRFVSGMQVVLGSSPSHPAQWSSVTGVSEDALSIRSIPWGKSEIGRAHV